MLATIGRHLTIDMYGCRLESFDNIDFAKESMLSAIAEANMTLLSFTYHQFEPQGLAVWALLAEGHMSIHTYPKMSYTAIDIFTYGENIRPEQAVKILKHCFHPEKIKTTNIKRGDFGSISDMKPKIKISVTPLRRVRDTGAKVIRFLSRSK